MLRSMVARTLWASHIASRSASLSEMGYKVSPVDIAPKLTLASAVDQRRPFHTTLAKSKVEDRKTMLASVPKMDEGTEGEAAVDIDSAVRGSGGMFPDENTPDLLFDGDRFADLPIIHMRTSKNNTLMTLTNAKGDFQLHRSCGIEGFRNCRKGTSVAAQATGISLATRATERGFKNVRVKVKGLGPGRMSGVKGLTMGGLNIVSISDVTFINWNNSPRPKKARKI